MLEGANVLKGQKLIELENKNIKRERIKINLFDTSTDEASTMDFMLETSFTQDCKLC